MNPSFTLWGQRDWNNPRYMKKWRLVKLFKISFGHGRYWEAHDQNLAVWKSGKDTFAWSRSFHWNAWSGMDSAQIREHWYQVENDEWVEHSENVQVQICPSKFGTLEIMNMKCSRHQHLMDQLFSCWSEKDWKRLLFFSSRWADDEGLDRIRWDQVCLVQRNLRCKRLVHRYWWYSKINRCKLQDL